MKQLQRFLWLVGLVVWGDALAIAKSHDQMPKSTPSDNVKIKMSVEASGAYNFNKYYTEPGFSPAAIPMKSNASNKRRLLLDIPSATLSIQKELSLSKEEAIKLALKMNLGKTITLGSVYADFKGFRIGKAATSFGDPDACGLVGGSFAQVKWQHKVHPLLSYVVAIEQGPNFAIYPKIEDEKPHNEIPTLSANVRYEEEKLWHIQLGGLFGILEYHNKKSRANTYIPSWGINIGAAVHLTPEQTTLNLQGVYGQGIGGYMADLRDLKKEANTVYTTGGESSTRETLDAWGAGVGVKHKWFPKLHSEATYRVVSTIDSDRNENAYKYGHAVSCGLFYHPIEQLKIGAQYLWGTRQNISTDTHDAHRIKAVVGFEL